MRTFVALAAVAFFVATLALTAEASGALRRGRPQPHLKQASNSEQGNESWDYFYFVQRWPGTECNFTRCSSGTSRYNYWVIHGLWPQRNDGSWPQFCSGPKFDPSRINDLLPQLEKYWPDLEKNDEDGFWSHEWNKHGTCASSDPKCSTEHDYFKVAVGLAATTNLVQVLSSAGITPGRSYSVSEYQGAVTKALGAQPTLTCQGGYYLHTINLCYTKALTLMNCPQATDGCKNNSALFLPYPPKN